MRTLQEKYNAVLEGNFSKTQFRRDAAMELPQFVSNVNSFDDTVAILKNKGIVTEAFGDEYQFGDTTYGDNQGLEVKSLAKQLYLGFKKMGARVRLDANRKKSPMGAEWGKDGLDQIDVLIWVGDSHKGYMVTVDLIGDKAMSFADKIMNDPKFSKFEFSKREIKTWGGQKGTELEVKPKVSKKGAVSVTEAKNQEPKYSTAKPADQVAPDVLDTGIKFELDKKYGTLDVTPEQYEKAKEAAVKNLAKDVLYYVKQDSIQLDTPGEKMEKAKLREGKEEAWKEFQKKHNVTDKTIKVAREDFEKEWEAGNLNETVDTDELRARIANILKGQLTSLRKIGGDAIIEDYIETQIQAYLDGDVDIEEPMEVVNDFRYYMDDNSRAAADFNADLEPDDSTPESPKKDDDKEGLEEGEVVDLPMTAAGYSRGETYDTEKYGKVKIIDQLDGDDIPAAYGRFRVEKINEEDKDKPSFYDYPENKHLDDRDPRDPEEKSTAYRDRDRIYLKGRPLKERAALKEMFKKIITKIITEEAEGGSDLMNIAQTLHRGFSEKGALAAAVGADGKTLAGNAGAAQVVITLKDDHIILKAKTSSAGDNSQATVRQVEDALEGIRTSANSFQVKTTKSLPGEFTAVIISK